MDRDVSVVATREESLMEEEIICKLCSAASHLKFNIRGYIQHIRLFHAHNANFRTVCGINSCLRSFTNFGTFTNHVYSVHGGSSRAECEVVSQNDSALNESHEDERFGDWSHATEPDNECESELLTTDLDNQPSFSHDMLQESSAAFLLGIKEKFKLTQASLQGIIQGVTALNHQNMSALKMQIYSVLNAANISPSQISGLQECLKQYENPLKHITSNFSTTEIISTLLSL